MSTVKIKTEQTATAAATAVDVQVKLESSLSTADIKLESDSDIGSEEEYIKSENDDDDEDTDQNQTTDATKKQRQFICKHHGCGRGFNSSGHLSIHQHEHRLQTELNILGITYILGRQSLDDPWPCPVPGCKLTTKTANALRAHTRRNHSKTVKQQHEQQLPTQITQRNLYFLNVDNFYVNGIRCGYHITIGVFICHECKLVPDCLLTHLQQKHGHDEKSIDNSVLPESAANASADPNINQHTSNSFLAAAIREPYQLHHRDIVQGWLCVTSNCGYCGYTSDNKGDHKRYSHQGENMASVPALVMRFLYAKTQASYFLITRVDNASGTVTANSNTWNQHKLDYNQDRLNNQDENGGVTDQNETTEASNQRQWKCEYPDCGRFFNSSDQLGKHRHEHKLEIVTRVHGSTFTLTRQSLDERWTCPIQDCGATCKTIRTTCTHIQNVHCTWTKHKRYKMKDDDNSQQKITKRKQPTFHYLNVDDFYVCGTRCGYHTATEVFICHECKLVPECLLTHLQQKHEFDEKTIDTAILPQSAGNAGTDTSTNQHTSNQLLKAAISQPYQQHNPDIIQGWLCVTSNCGYCGYTSNNKGDHKRYSHQEEQISTIPALVLRLGYGRTHSSCFLITRLDTISNSSANLNNSASQHNNECDDGDELVLSDYSSDEDDIH